MSINHTAEKNLSYWLAAAADDRRVRPATVTAKREIRSRGQIVPAGATIELVSVSNAGFRGIEIFGRFAGEYVSVSAGAVAR